jgi:hypothetical protein
MRSVATAMRTTRAPGLAMRLIKARTDSPSRFRKATAHRRRTTPTGKRISMAPANWFGLMKGPDARGPPPPSGKRKDREVPPLEREAAVLMMPRNARRDAAVTAGTIIRSKSFRVRTRTKAARNAAKAAARRRAPMSVSWGRRERGRADGGNGSPAGAFCRKASAAFGERVSCKPWGRGTSWIRTQRKRSPPKRKGRPQARRTRSRRRRRMTTARGRRRRAGAMRRSSARDISMVARPSAKPGNQP